MSNITVHAGINNPTSSPSRIFEIESLNFDFENTTVHQIYQIGTDVRLMYIIAECEAITRDVCYNVANIMIVDNCVFNRAMNVSKMVKYIEGFKPFNMPLDFARIVNDCIYKTINERAYSASQWAKVVTMAEKIMLLAKKMLSDVFTEGVSTVYDGDKQLHIIPSKSVIELLGVTIDELHYGITLSCNGEEVVIMSQSYENLILELKELCGLVDKVKNDDTELKIFANAVGIIAAFME